MGREIDYCRHPGMNKCVLLPFYIKRSFQDLSQNPDLTSLKFFRSFSRVSGSRSDSWVWPMILFYYLNLASLIFSPNVPFISAPLVNSWLQRCSVLIFMPLYMLFLLARMPLIYIHTYVYTTTHIYMG